MRLPIYKLIGIRLRLRSHSHDGVQEQWLPLTILSFSILLCGKPSG